MKPNKETLTINFAKGVNTKTDPWQVAPGNFLSLVNSVFTKEGLLQKRNGFPSLSTVSDLSISSITTFNDNLTAIGNNLYAYNEDSESFINKSTFQPLSLNTVSLVKNNLSQIQCDSATAPNNAVCVAYTESNNGSSSYKYSVLDGNTGQVLVAPTLILPTSGAVSGSPRVFVLGQYFIVVFTVTISSANHLQYFAISYNSFVAQNAAEISTNYTAAANVAFDGVVSNNNLYVAWNAASSAGIIITYLTSTLTLATPENRDAAHTATSVSVTADSSTIYVSYYSSSTSNGYVFGVNQALSSIFTPKEWATSLTLLNVTSSAQNGICTIFYETSNVYSYDSGINSNYTSSITCTNTGTLGSPDVLKRSVGLGSKSFIVNGVIYVLCAFNSPYQPSYFLLNASGKIVASLAYENGGGYLTLGLPQVSVNNNIASAAYLFKDFVASLNSGTTNAPQTPNIYFQTGINLSNFTIGSVNTYAAEIGSTLNLTGGFLWSYDGSIAFENGFFLYPDSIEATWATTGGNIHAQPDGSTNTAAYFYQVTYEWSDNQGNQYHSTPSIPIAVTTTGSGTTGAITVNIPTLRLSYKTSVKICVYRWSVANQIYYQTTSITAPTLNDPTTDSIAFVDTNADSSIIGNPILYTAGGVIEDTAAPSATAITLFDNRLWLVDAEDQNLLWYSKQVIESTPVEMSDLFTFYVSPTQSAQGSTGPIKAIAPMDDKLMIFKQDAIYYINGTGPDNTGSNSQFSQPIFITSTVGCSIPNSIVFIPDGLLFQSDKGIWLVSRDLQTSYIGAPVELYTTNATVNSAVNVPGTNQVRFTMSSGITLMYDYFYGQWGTFENIPAVSGTIYKNLHTILSPYLKIQQETSGVYLDVSSPVLLSFQTSWFNLAGLQGYQRAFWFYLLGQYQSPHKLMSSIAYDYNPSIQQATLVTPVNFGGVYGGATPNPSTGLDSSDPYGQDATYGGTSQYANSNVLDARVFLAKQRCISFQLTIQEVYDSSFGVPPGEGLTLSGINLVFGKKSGFYPIPANRSYGGGGTNL